MRLVCFTGGPFADEAREMGIDTLVMDCGVPEAVRRLYVENFPVTVIIDSEGNNLYEIGRQNYLDSMRQREACGSGV